MSIMKKILLVVLSGGFIVLNACDPSVSNDYDYMEYQNDSVMKSKLGNLDDDNFDSLDGIDINFPYSPVINNDIPFVYDELSVVSYERLLELPTITAMIVEYSMIVLHENGETCYTVYRLSDGRLVFVIFTLSTETGVTLYPNDYVLYPYSSIEQELKMSFLLPKDLPEEILR
jgi:hypothetical protein